MLSRSMRGETEHHAKCQVQSRLYVPRAPFPLSRSRSFSTKKQTLICNDGSSIIYRARTETRRITCHDILRHASGRGSLLLVRVINVDSRTKTVFVDKHRVRVELMGFEVLRSLSRPCRLLSSPHVHRPGIISSARSFSCHIGRSALGSLSQSMWSQRGDTNRNSFRSKPFV
jgi:hypothetical protein